MQSHLNLLIAALFLVGVVHADGSGEYPVASNAAQLQTTSAKASQDSSAKGGSTPDSRHAQEDDSDDCN